MSRPPRLIFWLGAAAAISALIPAAASAATISSSTANPLLDGFTNDAECSLREMVQIANVDDENVEPDCDVDTNGGANPLGNDTIQLGAGTYQLSIARDTVTPDINDGDLEAEDGFGDGSLTIAGLGSGTTIIDGDGATTDDRVFEAGGGTFRLEDLTVRDGRAPMGAAGGGGIQAGNTSVELEGVVVTENSTVAGGFGAGGGIFISGLHTLTLSNTTVEKNVADGTGGGIELRTLASLTTAGSATIGGDDAAEGNTAGLQGGGINMSTDPGGDITLNPGATVQHNNSVAFGGGIAHTAGGAGSDSDLTITAASITNNDVADGPVPLASGGGIYHESDAADKDFTVTSGSAITDNTATGEDTTGAGINAVRTAGTFNITQSSVSDNTATVQDDGDPGEIEGGGGIALSGAAPSTLTETTVRDNTVTVQDLDDAAAGGGILDNATLTIDSSLVAENIAQGGHTTDQNLSPRGAGLYSGGTSQGPTDVTNSTFSGNDAVVGVGSTAGSAGGGIFGDTGTQPLEVVHSTFADNNGQFGDSMHLTGGNFGPNLTLRGSLFDEDGNFACFPNGLANDSNAFNVDVGTSCVGGNVDTDFRGTGTTPLNLDGLGPDGGFTETRSLLAGSPAIDFVPNSAPHCRDLTGAALTVDQRGAGFSRPEGAACDAGSFEAQDTDDDGVVDVNDNCPAQVGVVSNAGCPAVAVTPVTPTTPTTPTASTAPPKKCKKGQKLKKGKCVKKKRKKRK